MAITMDMIKELRNATGVSITECKNALEATGGDIDSAIEELRKKGMAKAGKRADNATSEGRIKISTNGGKAFIVAVTCETDFVTRSESFESKVNEALSILEASDSADSAKSEIEGKLSDWILELGENIRLPICDVIEGEVTASYVHSNHKVAAVVAAKSSASEDDLKQVAMHVTATDAVALYAANFPADVIEKEKALQLEMMKDDPSMAGKPDNVLENIIAGKMKKFVNEQTLAEQSFIVNPEQTIKQFIGEDTITSFKKFSI